MAISDITGESNFDEEPPSYHWAFIAFLISFGFLPLTWLIPLPGICLINIIISFSLFSTFFSLYIVQFSENKQQYLVNIGYLLADNFGINVINLYNNAIEMKESESLSGSSSSSLWSYITGKKNILIPDTVGYNDYATVVVKTVSSN